MRRSTPLSRVEFIGLLAMLFAMVAFSIDSMLPALPRIAAELSPEDPNRAQLVLTSFVLGMGVGTFFTGPISDTYGRKPVILVGMLFYVLGAILAYFAQGLELVLAARVLQGLGASAPRTVGIAIVRDLYAGRGMAQILSFVMMVFTLVPAVAPLLGTGIIALFGWRGIFGAFVSFAFLTALWLSLRQPESLPKAARKPFQCQQFNAALREMAANPSVRLSILGQALCFGILFMVISLVQPIFETVFDRAASFPLWFAAMALVSGLASLLNAALVMRLGMRNLASIALGVQTLLSLLFTLIWLLQPSQSVMFHIFVFWVTTIFFQSGLSLGNLNAITMEPLGHIAGTAASVSGGIATVIGAGLAIPVGLTFHATPLPLSIGVASAAGLTFMLLRMMRRLEMRQPV